MSYTTFTANPAALIAQPGRAVNTFPSGLVRVDQTYLGLTAQAATHRATLAIGNDMPDGDSSPCIDGLKIFPEVQERRREDGFTEFIVSAYGRCNATGQKTLGDELNTCSFTYGTNLYFENKVFADTLTWQFCVHKNSFPSLAVSEQARVFDLEGNSLQTVSLKKATEFFAPNELSYGLDYVFITNSPKTVLSLDKIIVNISSNEYNELKSVFEKAPFVKFKIAQITKTNYGDFDEWTVLYRPLHPILDYSVLGIPSLKSNIAKNTIDDLVDVSLTNVFLGDVFVAQNITPPFTYSPLVLNNTVIVSNGFAILENDAVTGVYKITHGFGYYINNVLGFPTFTPFSRPPGGTWNGLGSGPQNTITQGAATWELDMGPDLGGNGGAMYNYVYNLRDPLYMWFKWDQNLVEDGVTTTFTKTGSVKYEPEVLVP